MTFDLRFPLGVIFTLFGGILVVYGLVGGQPPSLGVNVNLCWGAVVLVFGLWMLFLALRARRRRASGKP